MTRAGDFVERTTGALGESGALALIMPSGAWLLSPKDGTPEAAGATLDSSMVALVLAELPEHDLEFVNSGRTAIDAVATDQAQAVVLLRSVPVDQIAEWARAGRRMPPKSTYFHPKPRTGMVFRTLGRTGLVTTRVGRGPVGPVPSLVSSVRVASLRSLRTVPGDPRQGG